MASLIMLPTVCLGLSELNGSWNIICILRLSLRISSFFRSNTDSPLNKKVPPVGSSSLSRTLPVVVFPHPLSPTSPSVSARATLKVTPSTAFTYLMCIRKGFSVWTGKYFLRFSTVIRLPFLVSCGAVSCLDVLSLILYIEPAGDLVSTVYVLQFGLRFPASVHDLGASWPEPAAPRDRKSTRLNSSHSQISY